jgi:hypothetical protein
MRFYGHTGLLSQIEGGRLRPGFGAEHGPAMCHSCMQERHVVYWWLGPVPRADSWGYHGRSSQPPEPSRGDCLTASA